MTSSFSNIRTGPCQLLLDGVSVGYTEGDATFSDGLQVRERKVAQFGENAVDLIGIGQQPLVTVRIAEGTLANLQAWMPEGAVSGGSLYFGRKPGWKASDYAKRLTLVPLDSAGAAEVCLFRAVVRSRGLVGFNSENDRVYEVTFLGLVDETRTDGQLIGYITLPSGS